MTNRKSNQDTNAIIKFINLVFNLPALESLPDEQNAQQAGKQIYNQDNLGPTDDPKNRCPVT
jgi:hypothetical protein